MRLAYVDETYTADQFWIVALVISDTEARGLEDRLNAVVERTNRAFPSIALTTELHGYALDDGSEGWEPLKSKPQARVDAFGRAINAICDTSDVYLIRGGVRLNKVDWNTESNDPHEWALKFVLEKINREFHSEPVLVICDDVNQREKYRAAYGSLKRNGTGGYNPCSLKEFVDGLHFTPSHHSRLVQAADLAAYVFRRNSISIPTNARSAQFYQDLWDLLQGNLTHRIRIWP